jgi:hypothetical protein
MGALYNSGNSIFFIRSHVIIAFPFTVFLQVFVALCIYSILSIKNGNDNVPIEDNCLEEELATTPKLSEIGTLSLTFVMLMRFARLNIYYKTFTSRIGPMRYVFIRVYTFLRQSANYRHCSSYAQISPVVLKNKQ